MAHLHLHSQYSVIDGRGLIDDYVKLAKGEEAAIALTDHGTLGGVLDGYLASKKAGIKFIPGMEMYVDAFELRERNYPGHLTVLAKSEAGYRALIAANNLAHRQFYYKPRLTLQQIIDNHFAEEWIILSGCMSSPLFDWSLAEAENMVKQLAKNSGGFFLEAMWHYSADEEFQVKRDTYLQRVASLHKATGIPIVLTNDCHFAAGKNEELHIDLMAGSRVQSELEFDGKGFYYRSGAKMREIARDLGIPNAWDLSDEIAASCNVAIPEADKVKWYVPDITQGQPERTLRDIAEKRLLGFSGAYRERFEYEMGVLTTSPAILNSYLVAYDVVTWCDNNGIPMAARGSMAGSLVSFLLGITKEDPIKYNLSFSRAVNPARPTIPDFDLDVSSVHRGAVLEYLRERYEGDIPIAAYTHYGPRGALRKILSMEAMRNPREVNELSKQLPDDWPPEPLFWDEEAQIWYHERQPDPSFVSPTQHRTVPVPPNWMDSIPDNLKKFVPLYRGLYSSVSVHPSGVLVSGPERELEHEVPLQYIASNKTLVSAFDMYTLKKMGLFKLDVLGLRTLDQLDYMERVSNDRLPNDDYDDPKVLKAFSSDLLAEIFQMDGYAAREVIQKIDGIKTFEDIIAANTLARPGAAQFTEFYRQGRYDLLQEYPMLEPVLGYTKGLILYQEQVMEITRVLADFDDAEQDDVKEAIKYFRHEEFKHIADKFCERTSAKGVDPTKILAGIVDMSKYSFNRAHAMTYAAIAYKMMWYKVYYPAVYYAAVFDAAGDRQRLVLESHFFGVQWVPADINSSESDTVVRDGKILLGLSAIKGVGPAAYQAIAEKRPYVSLEDFEKRVERRKCNIKVISNLKDAFACTSIGIAGKHTAFQEAFDFSYSYLNSNLSQELTDWSLDPTNKIFRCAGFVTDIRSFEVRKAGPNQGKEMGRADVVNIMGKKQALFFPDVWKKARGVMFQGAAIKLHGSYNLTNTFIVESAEAV